ncbi:MAG: hypothetical protein H6601_06735 [Flavobacteriales bacterium]|nr:hypothetical protein [Flavobacteriales bacterium]MCB9186427.1 hypothetical protein [Flavobacteriales bacterium]
MEEKEQSQPTRKIDPEHLRQFQHEAEIDRLFYLEFEKNILAIENHEHYLQRCLDFWADYGVPNCDIRTLGGEILCLADAYKLMTQYFELNEDYESAAKLVVCEEMPEQIPLNECSEVMNKLKQYYLDSTMMMSYEESMVKVQQRMVDTTEFYGLSNSHDYVKVMGRVMEYHHGKLPYEEMMVLEGIRTETVELFGANDKNR